MTKLFFAAADLKVDILLTACRQVTRAEGRHAIITGINFQCEYIAHFSVCYDSPNQFLRGGRAHDSSIAWNKRIFIVQ